MSVLYIRDQTTGKFIPIQSIKGDPGSIDNVTIASIAGLQEALDAKQAAGDYLTATDTAADSAKLGGVAASEYAKKTDIPEDSGGDADTLGGKAPEYYVKTRNLLDNSDFKNPVNQREASGTISTAGYFIDRWKLVSGSVTISTDGLTLNGTICQILERAPGGTVSAAASAGTAEFDADTNTFSLTGSGDVVTWAALYVGEYTADTLPPYVAKGYAAEWEECRRYFAKIWCNAFTPLGFGNVTWSSTLCRIMINGTKRMRTLPTVTMDSADIWINGSRISNITLTTVYMGTEIGLDFTIPAHTLYLEATLYANWLELSADM